jgi:hypothetical protein
VRQDGLSWWLFSLYGLFSVYPYGIPDSTCQACDDYAQRNKDVDVDAKKLNQHFYANKDQDNRNPLLQIVKFVYCTLQQKEK